MVACQYSYVLHCVKALFFVLFGVCVYFIPLGKIPALYPVFPLPKFSASGVACVLFPFFLRVHLHLIGYGIGQIQTTHIASNFKCLLKLCAIIQLHH